MKGVQMLQIDMHRRLITPGSYDSQQIKKIKEKFVGKNVDTDNIPVDYEPLTQKNNIDTTI